MIETYDVKENMRESDTVFRLLNHMEGSSDKQVFPELLEHTTNIFANLIRQGKVDSDKIESYESHISQFAGKNSDKYFIHSHKDLPRATKASLEIITMAEMDLEQRMSYAEPVMSSDSYEKGYRIN